MFFRHWLRPTLLSFIGLSVSHQALGADPVRMSLGALPEVVTAGVPFAVEAHLSFCDGFLDPDFDIPPAIDGKVVRWHVGGNIDEVICGLFPPQFQTAQIALPVGDFVLELYQVDPDDPENPQLADTATLRALPSAALPGSDFGPDGIGDILVRETFGGTLSIISLAGDIPAVTELLDIGVYADIVGAADLDGNGATDIVLRDPLSNSLSMLAMRDNRGALVEIGHAPLDWRVVGLGDLTGDRQAELVIRHRINGHLAMAELVDGQPVVTSIGALRSYWLIVGVADLGGDGRADIIIRNRETGQFYLYEMDGANRIGSNIGSVPLDWAVVGVQDLGGDGKADIVIRHKQTGQLYLMEMDGNQHVDNNIGALPIPLWTVIGFADFNADGKADMLIQNGSTRQFYLFEMDHHRRRGRNIGAIANFTRALLPGNGNGLPTRPIAYPVLLENSGAPFGAFSPEGPSGDGTLLQEIP